MIKPNQGESPATIVSSPSESFINRRKVISTLGLASTALCASTVPSAAWFWKDDDDIPVVKVNSSSGRSRSLNNAAGEFPEEWVRLQGRNLKGYASYINSLKLKNISTHDVISAHAKQRGTVWNCLPPRQWWKRMGYTLKVVDRVSSTIKVPVKEIVSAYRCPKYNARCSGAKRRSWHQANVALDVKFHTSARTVTAHARSLRDRGLFKGGIGSYSSFTHIDTRGTNVNW